jgi:glyoxylase-like metal-dependent hydrolase (beta-lactamase superfamily II)
MGFPRLTAGRPYSFLLLLTDDGPLLLDAGNGHGRLRAAAIRTLLRPYDNLRIVLSYYHVDHVASLPYLAGSGRGFHPDLCTCRSVGLCDPDSALS